MTAFVRLNEVLSTRKDLAREMEKLTKEQQKQGRRITGIYVDGKLLEPPPASAKRRIGSATPVEKRSNPSA